MNSLAFMPEIEGGAQQSAAIIRLKGTISFGSKVMAIELIV